MAVIKVTQVQTIQNNGTYIDGTTSSNLIILNQILAFHAQGIDPTKITILSGDVPAEGLFWDMSLFTQAQDLEMLALIRNQTVFQID
jgi:hypothetical protein